MSLVSKDNTQDYLDRETLVDVYVSGEDKNILVFEHENKAKYTVPIYYDEELKYVNIISTSLLKVYSNDEISKDHRLSTAKIRGLHTLIDSEKAFKLYNNKIENELDFLSYSTCIFINIESILIQNTSTITAIYSTHNIFNIPVEFTGDYHEEIIFSHNCFLKEVSIHNCLFKHSVRFSNSIIRDLFSISDNTIITKGINISDSHYKGFLNITQSKINGFFQSSSSKFDNIVKINSSHLDEVRFSSAFFNEGIDLRLSSVSRSLYLNNIGINQEKFFIKLYPLEINSISYNYTDYKESSEINGEASKKMVIDEKSFPDYINIHNVSCREDFLIFKQSAINQHDQINALNFHIKEYEKHYQELSWKHDFGNKLLLFIENLVSNYGTNYLFPIICYFNVGFILYHSILLWGLEQPFYTLNTNIDGSFFVFLNPTHKTDFLGKDSLNFIGYFLDFLFRPLSAFFIYEFVKSLRKFSRKL